MANLTRTFTSEFRDEPKVWGDTKEENDEGFYYHDIYTGTLILGHNLGEAKGADIYLFHRLDKNPRAVFKKAIGLIKPENIYKHLVSFGRIKEIAVHLDTGEPGGLAIAHLPLVEIDYIRQEDLTEL